MNFLLGCVLFILGLAIGITGAVVIYDEHHKAYHGIISLISLIAAGFIIALGYVLMTYTWPN